MSKILFIPFSVAGGIVAGLLGKKAFERVWGAIANEEAPDPKHREIEWKKLIPALMLEGAIFSAVRGVFDHLNRRAFNRATGQWPGEARPQPE